MDIVQGLLIMAGIGGVIWFFIHQTAANESHLREKEARIRYDAYTAGYNEGREGVPMRKIHDVYIQMGIWTKNETK